MLLRELPVLPRQGMVIVSFLCFAAVVPLFLTFRRRKQTGNMLLTAAVLVLAYFSLQSLSGVARLLAWSYVDERFARGAALTLALPALPLLAAFGAMLGLTALLVFRALRCAAPKPPDARYSSLKVRLHDAFGLSLVATRAYFDGQEIDRDAVRLLYARCRDCFGGETVFSCRSYESIEQVGRFIGVTLSVTGTLPEDERVRPVVCAALSECMLNTFRHAWGNRVTAEVTGDAPTVITVRNNGRQPTAPIRETGGLKHLRGYAEGLGIAMTVESMPQFTLTLTIPQEVQHGL